MQTEGGDTKVLALNRWSSGNSHSVFDALFLGKLSRTDGVLN